MKRFVLLLIAVFVVLAFAIPSHAQTTTSTSSSSTSTSTTLALTWSCNRDFTTILPGNGPYNAIGKCTATGAYQNGGAPLGSAATAKATAQALCGSGNQTVVDLILSPNMASGVANYYCSFSLSTFLVQCATTIGTEISTSNVTPGPLNYVAYCK